MTRLEKALRAKIADLEAALAVEAREAEEVHGNWSEATRLNHTLDALRGVLRSGSAAKRPAAGKRTRAMFVARDEDDKRRLISEGGDPERIEVAKSNPRPERSVWVSAME